MGRLIATLLALIWASSAQAHLVDLKPVKPSIACEALKKIALEPATSATTIIASAKAINGAKHYCEVRGTIAPAITFEVRLPLIWTQRYLQTGCGGLCGNLRVNAEKTDGCIPVVDNQIVLASTDMGHQSQGPGDASWANDPQKRIDFAHRGVHVTALAAKALIKAYYGQAPHYSYFSGCSDGGREALMEAQRYPGDFDGIAAGAPALNFTVQNSFYHAWQALSNTGPDGLAILNADDLQLLHTAVLAACDKLDGLEDGQITDPRQCRFDLVSVQCKLAAQRSHCLTTAQVAAARKLYDGPRTPDGQRMTAGGPSYGSELSWAGVYVPRQRGGLIFSKVIALETMRYLLWEPGTRASMEIDDLKFDAATFASLEAARKLYNADDPNLGAFAARGGKMILWHGWSDPHISPANTIDYWNNVGAALTPAKRDAFVRLFLIPAMYHCSGGEGPSDFPLFNALMKWVEGGTVPNMVIAKRDAATLEGLPGLGPRGSAGPGRPPPGMMHTRAIAPQTEGGPAVSRTRPIFAYPAVAKYKGSGSVDDAASFERAAPRAAPQPVRWLGSR